jgi:hypothetical protein
VEGVVGDHDSYSDRFKVSGSSRAFKVQYSNVKVFGPIDVLYVELLNLEP